MSIRVSSCIQNYHLYAQIRLSNFCYPLLNAVACSIAEKTTTRIRREVEQSEDSQRCLNELDKF